jgi:uncharacterized protein
MKIAIIGTGISGLGAAYLLHAHHDITVYEKNAAIGGHSRTITLNLDSKAVPVDTGFIVFNKRNYPFLTGLFKHLGVQIDQSDMSFGVSVDNGMVEYGSKGMFAQKRNLLRPKFWGMIFDILYFNKNALRKIRGQEDITLRDLLDQMKMGDWFRRYYLQAMGAAIWSCSVETILDFPAQTFLNFFKNHGLLTVNDHPQWYTVNGGSKEYIKKLTAGFVDKIKVSSPVVAVKRSKDYVTVEDAHGDQQNYDHVIFACHADQVLGMLADASEKEQEILGSFSYQNNHVVVHGDIGFMPQHTEAWASWVYLSQNEKDNEEVVSLSYWMNNLQQLNTDKPVIITLNPQKPIKNELVYDRHDFSHPVFTLQAIHAQRSIEQIQNVNRVSFCGAYQRYGFHEDGLLSAVNVAQKLGAGIPWK